MRTVPFAVYDAFSDTVFGGSQGGIVLEADGIDADMRLKIAKELGLPAICFVTSHSKNSITARFQSTEREYPMCGHGTICLMTHMIEQGLLDWKGRDRLDIELILPNTRTDVELHRHQDNRTLVMLGIEPPVFHGCPPDTEALTQLLGIPETSFNTDLPIEVAQGDFAHLIVPVKDLNSMQAITPNFPDIIQWCQKYGLETIACFCTQTQNHDHFIHVRDFCPAVGVPESAAAGTTNAALTSYLIRHKLVTEDKSGKISIKAEQGLEIMRPSSIQSSVLMKQGAIVHLQVGGIATKIFDGRLHIP